MSRDALATRDSPSASEVCGEIARETLHQQVWDLSYTGRVNLREGDYEVALRELRKLMRRSLRLQIPLAAWWFVYGIASMVWGSQSENELGSTGWKTGTLNFWLGLGCLIVGVGYAVLTAYTYGRRRDACETVARLIRRSKEADA